MDVPFVEGTRKHGKKIDSNGFIVQLLYALCALMRSQFVPSWECHPLEFSYVLPKNIPSDRCFLRVERFTWLSGLRNEDNVATVLGESTCRLVCICTVHPVGSIVPVGVGSYTELRPTSAHKRIMQLW